MVMTLPQALFRHFLGTSPDWYKLSLLACLVINPLVFFLLGGFVAGWLLLAEFIFTLTMALKCYPLQPGGLLALEAVGMGMTDAHHVMDKVSANLDVLLLLVFMVAGITFMKPLLLKLFTRLLVGIPSKRVLSLCFCLTTAALSAFLDALTVMAVVISVSVGFYAIYHRVASARGQHDSHDHADDTRLSDISRTELQEYRRFLRSLLLHASMGTALGGVMTMVGEPQNLIIADQTGWSFGEFFLRLAPVTIPVLAAGLGTCLLVESRHLCGYGQRLPDTIRQILIEHDRQDRAGCSVGERARLWVQLGVLTWLMVALAQHQASVGLIGLAVIVLASSLLGITEEHALGHAFEEALPFTALLVVFFTIVAVIVEQHLFAPVIDMVLDHTGGEQLGWVYLSNGLLSMVSDNVFVGTVYISEIRAAFQQALISAEQFDLLSVAVATGTNLPSVAMPNGQAAFLFLLTSAVAPLVRLSYRRMVWMAAPYTLALSLGGFLCVRYGLEPASQAMQTLGWL